MEYLNVYDSNKKKLNKKIVRGESLPDGEHILVTVIFIKNSLSNFLIPISSPNFILSSSYNSLWYSSVGNSKAK